MPPAIRSTAVALLLTVSTAFAQRPDSVKTSVALPMRGKATVKTSTPPPPPPPPPSVVFSVSPTHGTPGTRVLITYPFGSQTQALLYVDNRPGPLWAAMRVISVTPTGALAEVPFFAGSPAFDGFLQVNGSCGTTPNCHETRTPFHYEPRIEQKTLTLANTQLDQSAFPQADSHLTGPGAQNIGYVQYEFSGLLGGKGDDVFFNNIHLGAGWTVVSASVSPRAWIGHGGANLVEYRPGTDMPYVKVHWWADLLSTLSYSVNVVVQGPAGGRACSQCTGHYNGSEPPE